MHLDILIFAIIAAVLIYRLNAVLGTRDGNEPPRANPFGASEVKRAPPAGVSSAAVKTLLKTENTQDFVDAAANAEGKVSEGLAEITEVEGSFNAGSFMSGARHAFDLVVNAYATGDRVALRPLLSPKLYGDFDRGITAREASGAPPPPIPHIREARIVEAHLGGTMAYVTVAYTVQETEDKDIWTFTRDTRADDPNWILIETRAAEE